MGINWFELFVSALIEGGATLLGVFLGFKYGIRQDRSSRAEVQLEARSEASQSLLNEVIQNLKWLNTGLRKDNKNQMQYFPFTLYTDSLGSLLRSGKFSDLSPECQSKVRSYKRMVENLNFYNVQFNQGKQMGWIKEQRDEYNSKITGTFKAAFDFAVDIESELEKEII